MPPVDSLRRLAARQHGLAHKTQIFELGFDHAAFRHLVRGGDWCRRSPTVLELLGTPRTDAQELMLALLDAGTAATLSHHTAAARWGLSGFSLFPVHVTESRERGRRASDTKAIIHQPRLLLPEHLIMLDGIRTTTPARTLFDLAAVLHAGRVERALDNALAAHLTTIPRLTTMLRQLAKKGRPGITVMRALLDARPPSYVPPASGLESRFQQLARKAGWWTFERQVDVGDEHGWLARVDFVERAERLIVEVQSDRFHTALLDVHADQRRMGLLRAAGWRVYEAIEHDLWYKPAKIIHDLWSLRRR